MLLSDPSYNWYPWNRAKSNETLNWQFEVRQFSEMSNRNDPSQQFPWSPRSNSDNQYYCPNTLPHSTFDSHPLVMRSNPPTHTRTRAAPRWGWWWWWAQWYGRPPNGREDGNLQTPINRQLFGQYHFPNWALYSANPGIQSLPCLRAAARTNERTWIRRNVFLRRRRPTMSEPT